MLFFSLIEEDCVSVILTQDDDDDVVIQSGDQLTDEHINAAQKLIKEQFNHLQGLQDTLLSQKREEINAVEQSAGSCLKVIITTCTMSYN